MPFIGASLLLQMLCALHCYRTGRNRWWLSIILIFSIPGCFIYFLCEIAPDIIGRRDLQFAKDVALRKIAPDKEVRAARDALSIVDTAANRTRLADALADNGLWKEAVPHYETALARTPTEDRTGQVKLARAYLESGNAVQARKLLETLPKSDSEAQNDRAGLLLARSLEALGETAKALMLYEELAQRLPGGEAHCRYAALLMAEGRTRDALEVLEEVERLARRLDIYERARNPEMYAWAERTLTELREAAL
ncbi:MAG TPA: tetratricopeptide repeat protein [Allosphingosinicella sp.]|uniref:tetratricopeptide repeat protein n=1 Tax=Allosphingosinicella sp. TaxID=2823234 RepID=UPI002ED8683A